MSRSYWFLLQLVIYIVVLVPTIIAMVTGAPWVPTPMARVRRMLELAKLKPGDRLYDLGCGDGRLVHCAAKEYGADAIGLELSPLIYLLGRVRNAILRSKSRILFRDFRGVDFGNARAIVFYLLPDVLKVMRPRFEEQLKPGTLIVSYAFQIEGWEPVHIEPKIKEKNLAPIYVYEFPTSMKEKGSEAKK